MAGKDGEDWGWLVRTDALIRYDLRQEAYVERGGSRGEYIEYVGDDPGKSKEEDKVKLSCNALGSSSQIAALGSK